MAAKGLRGALSPAEWSRLGLMLAVVVALHLIGWLALALIVEPGRFSLGSKAFGIGVELTAYALGMRHAFDADHIAASDNTTRNLMSDGQRPLGVGFFFSLGHSAVVFGLTLLLATGSKAFMEACRARRRRFLGAAPLHRPDRRRHFGRVLGDCSQTRPGY
jgi:high-affinity nickel-transport protein